MIRKARLDDARSLAKLARMMWSSSENELTKDFKALISNKDAAVFLYEADGKTVGFAQCQLRHDYVEGTHTSPVGYLEGIFVAEEHRKRGYARKLVNACQQWAKEMGCTEFASDCEADNLLSLAFHLRLGFCEANRIICFTKKI